MLRKFGIQLSVATFALLVLPACTVLEAWDDKRYAASKAEFESAKIEYEKAIDQVAKKRQQANEELQLTESTTLRSLFEKSEFEEGLDYIEYLYSQTLADIAREPTLRYEINALINSAVKQPEKNKQLRKNLDTLVAVSLDNEFARLLRGFFFNEWAYHVRGVSFSKDIPESQRITAIRLWRNARLDFEVAAQMNPDNYLSYIGLSSMGSPNLSNINRALAIQPGSFWAHYKKLWMLQPFWIGTIAQQESALENAKVYITNESQLYQLQSLLRKGREQAAYQKKNTKVRSNNMQSWFYSHSSLMVIG